MSETSRRPFTDAITYYDAQGAATTFKPLGKPIILNKRGQAPPALGARIIVETDVVALSMAVAAMRPKNDLMVFERGVYYPKSGSGVTLPGAQAVVFNSEMLDREGFAKVVTAIAKILLTGFQKPEAFVEVREGEFVVFTKLV